MPDPELTREQLASLVWPLYAEDDGAIVCDYGGMIEHGDGGFSCIDGSRFKVRPGDVVNGLTYEDLERRLAERIAERAQAETSRSRSRAQ